jgi:hypothetical protein
VDRSRWWRNVCLVVAGFAIGSALLGSIAAVLGGVVLIPIWFILTGSLVRSGEERGNRVPWRGREAGVARAQLLQVARSLRRPARRADAGDLDGARTFIANDVEYSVFPANPATGQSWYVGKA